jgi:mannose-6-phosphate isomerase-like protein (cupin superfamily)
MGPEWSALTATLVEYASRVRATSRTCAVMAAWLPAALSASTAFAQGAVPGGCAEPALEHAGEPGCFQSAELTLPAAPKELHWHLYEFRSEDQARSEAARHPWAAVTHSHGRIWLHVLAEQKPRVANGRKLATAGPLRLTAGTAYRARFIESIFTPGMRTRTHSHPGPEAFYVVSGAQCMDSPTKRARVEAGQTFVVDGGPHQQSAPDGRRNVAVVLYPEGQPFMTVVTDWTPSDYCLR